MGWANIFRSGLRQRPYAGIAPGCRIYAIGDVHGRADLLTEIFARIDADSCRHPGSRSITVLLGDYVDRGPAARETLEMLIRRTQSHETICLMGNHEAMLLRFLEEPRLWETWAQLGGAQTLCSYGLRPPLRTIPEQAASLARELAARLPPTHLAFLKGLPCVFESGDTLFVHAGVKPGIPLFCQSPKDLLWIRDEFLNFRGDFGKLVIHGHTPVEKPEFRPNRINIDTGAFATGRLSCLVLQDAEMALL